MGKHYDKKRTAAPMYAEGDLVMLDIQNVKIRQSTRKFDQKKQEPFRITKIVSRSAVRIELPKRWKIHDVFHISLLEPYRQATVASQVQPTPDEYLKQAGDLEEGPETFSDEDTPEVIFRSQKFGRVIEYLVRWERYPEEKD